MRNIVIDANVFAGYYREEILGHSDITLTDSPKGIFENLGIQCTVYFDNSDQIKSEWQSLADTEWFNAWFPSLLIEGKATLIKTNTFRNIEKKIQIDFGFPKSRDIWYIRVSKVVSDANGSCFLITEDIDFFDPSKKTCNHETKKQILISSSTNLCKYLKKNEEIMIQSVTKHLDFIRQPIT